jgi:hypothetical protein
MRATITCLGLLVLLLCHAVAIDTDQGLVDAAPAAESEIGVASASGSQSSTVTGSARPANDRQRTYRVNATESSIAGTCMACMRCSQAIWRQRVKGCCSDTQLLCCVFKHDRHGFLTRISLLQLLTALYSLHATVPAAAMLSGAAGPTVQVYESNSACMHACCAACRANRTK